MTRSLPVIDRPLDNTALDAYMTCPKKYYYSMVLHRRRKGSKAPLVFGTTWHKILELWYKGKSQDEIYSGAIASWEEHNNADDHRTLQRAISDFPKYVERWGDDRKDTVGWGTETPLVELSTNAMWDAVEKVGAPAASHPYAGKIDRLVRINGLLYVQDHKTSSQQGAYYFQQFDPSNQMMGYAWLCYHLTGEWIAGVSINAMGVLKKETKFAREIIPFSKDRLADWAANYNRWARRVEYSYTNQDFPHNFNACYPKYGACAYVSVCSAPPRIRDRVLEADYEINPWNPLEKENDDGE